MPVLKPKLTPFDEPAGGGLIPMPRVVDDLRSVANTMLPADRDFVRKWLIGELKDSSRNRARVRGMWCEYFLSRFMRIEKEEG